MYLVLKERLNELLDFARSESPYRSANKGWITDDVYLQVGKSLDSNLDNGEELADVSFYWKPIQELLIIIFAVVCLGIILIFGSISMAEGRFPLPTSSIQNFSQDIEPQSKEEVSVAIDVQEGIDTTVLESDSELSTPTLSIQLEKPVQSAPVVNMLQPKAR